MWQCLHNFLSQIFEKMGEKKDQAEATLQAFGRQVGRQVSRLTMNSLESRQIGMKKARKQTNARISYTNSSPSMADKIAAMPINKLVYNRQKADKSTSCRHKSRLSGK